MIASIPYIRCDDGLKSIRRILGVLVAAGVLAACQSTNEAVFSDGNGRRYVFSMTDPGQLKMARTVFGHTLPTLIISSTTDGDVACYGNLQAGCELARVSSCKSAVIKVSDTSFAAKCVGDTGQDEASGYIVFLLNPPPRSSEQDFIAPEEEGGTEKSPIRVLEFDDAGRLEVITDIDFDSMESVRLARVSGSLRLPD